MIHSCEIIFLTNWAVSQHNNYALVYHKVEHTTNCDGIECKHSAQLKLTLCQKNWVCGHDHSGQDVKRGWGVTPP